MTGYCQAQRGYNKMSHSIMVQLSVQHKMFPCTRAGLLRLCVGVCDIRVSVDAGVVHNLSCSLLQSSHLCLVYSRAAVCIESRKIWIDNKFEIRLIKELWKKEKRERSSPRCDFHFHIHMVQLGFSNVRFLLNPICWHAKPHDSLCSPTKAHDEGEQNVIRCWRWRRWCN